VLYVDPVAGGHTLDFDGSWITWDDDYTNVMLPFAFPHWISPTTTATTSTVGFGTNGGLVLGGGEVDCCSQVPLWLYQGWSGVLPTIHAHGADGYLNSPGRMYSHADSTMAVFTWVSVDYWGGTVGNWSVQVILYPTGSFTIYQIAATVATSETITIGFSDGSTTDNSSAGATNLDWDTQTIGAPFSVGQVDFGSSEAGGMATGRFLFFEYNATMGYTCTVTQ